MAEEVRVSIVLEGEEEYNRKIESINRACRLWESNLEKVKSAQNRQKESAETLGERLGALGQVQGKLNEKLAVTNQVYESAKGQQEAYGEAVARLREKQEEAEESQRALGELTKDNVMEYVRLSQEIEGYKGALQMAKEKQEEAGDSAADWGIRVNEIQTKLNNLNQELETNETRLGEVREEMNKGLGTKALEGIQELANAIKDTGILDGADAIAEALTQCVEVSAEFESSMAKIEAAVGTTAAPMEQIKDQILQVSTELGMGASQVAESAYDAISAGIDTAKSVEFVEQASKLAASGFMDNAAAMDILSTAVDAYNLEINNTSRVSDYLITAQRMGAASASELSAEMEQVIPAAAACGVEMDDLTSAYVVLSENGSSTAQSTEYLQSMFGELGDSGSAVSKILREQTGKSFGTLMENGRSLGDIMEILGDSVDGDVEQFKSLWKSSEAGAGAFSLLNAGAGEYNSVLQEMENSTGAANEAFEEIAGTAEFAKDRMDTAFQNMMIAVGDQLSPVLEGLADVGTEAFSWAEAFVRDNPEIVALIAAVTTGLGTMAVAITVISTVTTVATTVMETFSKVVEAHPAMTVATGVLALVSAIGTFIAVAGGGESETDKLVTKTKELREAVAETTEEYETQRSEIGTSIDAQRAMVDNLETMIQAEGRSEIGQQRIADMVSRLNAEIPGLSLAYDKQTNSLNLTTEAIDEMIEANQRAEEFDSHLEERAALLQQRAEATAAAAEAEETLAEAKARVLEMQTDGTEIWGAASYEFDQQQQLVSSMTDAYNEATQAIEEIDTKLAESQTYIEDYTISQSGLSESTLAYRDSILESAEAFGEDSAIYQAIREEIVALDEQYMTSVAEQQNRIEEIKAQQGELQAAYDETYQNVYNNLNSQMQLFQDVNLETDQSIEETMGSLIDSLTKQADYIENYTSNLAAAMEMNINKDLLAKLSDGSEESAKILQTIVEDGGAHIAELNAEFERVEEGKKAFSGQVAEMQTSFSETMDELDAELSTSIDEMNKSEATYKIALDNVQGFINGTADMEGRVRDTYIRMVGTAINAAKSKLCQNSPSRVFRKIGADNIQGDIEGAKGKRRELEITYADSAQAAIEAYEDQVQVLGREMEAKQYVSYLSMADITNASRTEQMGILNLDALAGRENGLRKLLEACISYLPYLEQMAGTYGRVYLNPREASREMAPFMNRDLKALGR